MRIALVSDIHGNRFYLDSVGAQLKARKVDVIYCLGDLVGYYDAPGEVIDWCLDNGVICIKGNHEKYLLNEITPDPQKLPLYRTELQRQDLSDKQIRFLESLPDEIEATHAGKSFYLTHSLPGNCIDYLFDVATLDKDFLLKFDYYCFGHTHIPMIRYHFGTAVINPGSVGQPRDYSRQPSYAILDLESNEVSLHKLTVDYKTYCKSLSDKNFDPKMIAVLTRTTR